MALKSFKTNTLNGVSDINGLVHIVTADTGGAVSSFSVNDCFSATFNTYKIILDLASSTGSGGLNLRLRVGGADTTTGIYKRQVLNTDNASNSALRSTTLTAWDSVWIADTTTKNSYPHNNFEIYRPFETVTTTGHRTSMQDPDGNIEMNHAVYGIGNTLSYTGFTLIPASGTINGTATVLGIKI